MCPEMIQKQGHNFLVDIYGLGALLYEMVFGYPPFYSQDTDQMFSEIMNTQLNFPSQIRISHELKQLLRNNFKFLDGLLCKDPNYRLGSQNGIQDVIN